MRAPEWGVLLPSTSSGVISARIGILIKQRTGRALAGGLKCTTAGDVGIAIIALAFMALVVRIDDTARTPAATVIVERAHMIMAKLIVTETSVAEHTGISHCQLRLERKVLA